MRGPGAADAEQALFKYARIGIQQIIHTDSSARLSCRQPIAINLRKYR